MELVDGLEESSKQSQDVVIEECKDVDTANTNSLDEMHLTPIIKTTRLSENNPDLTVNQIYDGGSIYTSPSMLSLISIPSKTEDSTRANLVSVYPLIYVPWKTNVLLLTRIQLMWYQKN